MSGSLRNRLILAAMALVAVGLVAASAATYTVLRNSLLDRTDKELLGCRDQAAAALEPHGGFPRFGGSCIGGPGSSIGYVALIDVRGGKVIEKTVGLPGMGKLALEVPSGLPGSTEAGRDYAPRFFIADSTQGRYRVLASALVDGGTFLVGASLADTDATLRRLLLIEVVVTAMVLGAVGIGARKIVEVGLRPLTTIEGTAAEIAAGDLSRRVEPAEDGTEVGRLGLALNAMLARIEAAFAERRASEEKLRRFVADASHELRTPLTSIRGYAELFRRGAKAKPADLTKSMRRIEEESARMSELVDELLLLARLDQGRPLEREPVDLAVVVRDAVEDARAVQPDRPIELSSPGETVVEGDEARLRQVAANLLSNALEHTPEGTRIDVKVRADGDRATLEVADEGPGLAPQDAEKVFDRFFRVDPARARERGGAGLGLAIVAAIVHAHGGSVSLLTSPGDGARFIVGIPLASNGARGREDGSLEPAPLGRSAAPPPGQAGRE